MSESPAELRAEIEKLERKHVENPEGRYFVPLANAYRKLGEVGRAESLLRDGLRRHPEYLSAHIVLGRCLADRGATADAEEEFRYVLSLDPQNLIALRTLGELALTAGERDDAVRWYQELLSVDPMNEEARRALQSLDVSPGEPGEDFEAGTGWWQAPAGEAGDAETGATEATGGWQDPGSTIPEEFEAGGVFGHFVELDAGEPPGRDAQEAGRENGEDGSIGVVTETIAELYARQGLHDRAIQVYRELIRRRGGDAALERRLKEVEEARDRERGMPEAGPPRTTAQDAGAVGAREEDADWLAGLDDPAPPAAPTRTEPVERGASQPVEAASDPFADSFLDGFDLGEPQGAEAVPAAAAAEPAAVAEGMEIGDSHELEQWWGSEASQADASGPTIAAELARLAAWRPEAQTESDPWAGGAAPAPSDAEDPAEETALPWSAAAADAHPPTPNAPTPAFAEDDLFPWELGEPVAEAPAIPEPSERQESAPPVGGGFDPFAFKGFMNEAGSGRGGGAGSSGDQEESSPPIPPAAGEPQEEASEDDDLESFQAWLRSLKR